MINDESLASSSQRDHVELMLRVARAYWEDGRTQAQIAQDIGYSRPTVSRLLQEARSTGMVHITISHALEHIRQLEQQLVSKYGLRHARVAEIKPQENKEQIVPRYAATLFTELCRPDSLITVSNGHAVAATVRQVQVCDWPKSNVAQMIGALSPTNPMTDSPDICRLLADRLGGTFTALPVPMILSNRQIAASMRKEAQIATTLTLGGGADVALVGIGAATEQRLGHIFDAYVDAATIREMHRRGVVGHICGHLIDAQGHHVRGELCERTISIDLERLRRIPLVIGVAWGEAKLKAIRACMLGHYISALVTDQATAEALLAM